MKIAVITVTRNDIYRFEEWCQYYEEYKKDIDVHIIADDASDSDYLSLVKRYFKDSIIVHRETNGGSNVAINDALKVALKDKDVDAIFVLDNDIKLKPGSIKALYDYLYSDDKLGMVGPIVLKKDSDIVEDFGVRLTLFKTIFLNQGDKLESIPSNTNKYVDVVPGGINMCKRSYYEKVGLQDEEIFMYCDERDMCYRCQKAGMTNGVTAKAVAWHQHKYCPPVGKRLRSLYLIARNRMFLQIKHKGWLSALCLFFWCITVSTLSLMRHINKIERRNEYNEKMKGYFAGIRNNMDNSNIWY